MLSVYLIGSAVSFGWMLVSDEVKWIFMAALIAVTWPIVLFFLLFCWFIDSCAWLQRAIVVACNLSAKG